MKEQENSRPAPVNERVASLVNRVIRAANGSGADQLGERLRNEASRWRTKETTVVVAGEPNRGKSTLVNALLGEELVPCGATATTGSFLLLRHGPRRRATVVRDGAESEEIPLEQLPELLATAPSEGLEGVVIETEHPLLSTGLVLVDTPGVGSLDAAHGRITLAALSRADAMIFVLDPAEPLSDVELGFLSGAADRIERVVFVMTRTDRHPHWRTVRDDDLALIDRHAPRFTGSALLPASARLALSAIDLGHDGLPDPDLMAESGVAPLKSHLLDAVVDKVAALRLANLIRLTRAVVEELERPARLALSAAEGAPEAHAIARHEQAEYDRYRDAVERLQVDVTDRFNALRETTSTEFSRRMRELSTQLGGSPEGSPDTDLVENVFAEVRASCAELVEGLDEQVAEITAEVRDVVGDLEFDPTPLELDPEALSTDDALVDVGTPDAGGKLRHAQVLASAGSGLGMATFWILGDNPELGILIGAGAIVAATVGSLNTKQSRRQQDEAGHRRRVAAALDAARTEVSPLLRQQILTAQRDLERAMKAAVKQRTRGFQDRINEANHLARADAAERESARAGAQATLGTLEPLRHDAQQLSSEVSQLLRTERAS